MSYEIIVLDLDGTLTNSEKIITPKTREALFRIQERGKKVVLASGRPTPGIVNLADELKLKDYGGYVLAFNGAKIINYETGEIIYNKTLPQEVIPKLYRTAKQVDIGILTYNDTEILLGNGLDEYSKKEAFINHMPMREVNNFPEEIKHPVNKCLMTGEPDKVLYAAELLNQEFKGMINIFRSEPYFLENMPMNVDKAYALGKLLEHLGMDKSQMICCGDGFNDLSMIQFAGLGVAMANAQKETKEAADYITASNDEDGVAQVIEKFMED